MPEAVSSTVSKDQITVLTKPTPAQQADRDWYWLMMAFFTPLLAYLAVWLLCLLLQAISTAADLSAQLLLSLLSFKQNSGTLLGAGLVLWIVFGGYRSLKAPDCLRHPLKSAQQQSVQDSCDKVRSVRLVAQFRRWLTDNQRDQPVTRAQQQATSNITTRHSHGGLVLTRAIAACGKETRSATHMVSSSTGGSSTANASGSRNSESLTAFESQGSPRTSLSSEDGGIDIDDCVVANKDHPVGSYDSDNEETWIPDPRPQKTMSIDLARLFNLNRIHGNPFFYEGPLDDVLQLAWNRRHCEVNSIYNLGETSSNFTGSGSFPDRPVSADKDDISCMLQFVRPWLPLALHSYLDKGGIFEVNKARNGMTGLNMLGEELELLWHQQRPLIMNGKAISVTDLSIIHAFQKSKTRSFRPACPPGLQGQLTSQSTHRQYLTDEQVVRINQGCVDYTEGDNLGYKCETLRELEHHPDHAGAKIKNPVLGWLEGQEGVDFYDANDYLPCHCGSQALQDHLNSRHEIEPGFDPRSYGHGVPALRYLGDHALDHDRQRKADHEAHFGHTADLRRSQGIAQGCDLHAVPTNNLWILVDGVGNLNDALIGSNNDLPVPGFTALTKYPPGFRMPQGFCEIAHRLLPPRCQHGYLHPPFADHCMGCFPNGDNHDDCAECMAHDAVLAIIQNPFVEHQYEAMCVGWDRAQWERVRKGEQYEQGRVIHEQKIAHGTLYFQDWPRVVVV